MREHPKAINKPLSQPTYLLTWYQTIHQLTWYQPTNQPTKSQGSYVEVSSPVEGSLIWPVVTFTWPWLVVCVPLQRKWTVNNRPLFLHWHKAKMVQEWIDEQINKLDMLTLLPNSQSFTELVICGIQDQLFQSKEAPHHNFQDLMSTS